jgi:hypothetical protein
MRELPGCVFSEKAEATLDRSFEHFARPVQSGKIQPEAEDTEG